MDIDEKIIAEIEEQYTKEFPIAMSFFEDGLQKDCTKFLNGERNEKLLGVEEVSFVVNRFYVNNLFAILFSIQPKMKAEKYLQKFFENIMGDPDTHDYFMENVVEYRELNENLPTKTKKNFSSARKCRKTADVISGLQSFGLTLLFTRKSKKKLKELAENPIIIEQIKILTCRFKFSEEDC